MSLVTRQYHNCIISAYCHAPRCIVFFLLMLASGLTSSSYVVSFTQFSATCGCMPLPALSLWPGRQPYRPHPVGGRRGGGPSSVASRSRNPIEIAPSLHHCFRTAHPFAQSVKSSPTEAVLSRSSRQRLGHLETSLTLT